MTTSASEYAALLAEIQNSNITTYTTVPTTEPRFSINANTRAIEVPSEFTFLGVRNDHKAETIYFEIDRYFDDVDLSEHTCVIQFLNKNASETKEGVYPVTTIDVDSVDGKIVFGWNICNDATQLSGDIVFSVRFYSIDENGLFTYNFNTLSASSIILETLNTADSSEIITSSELEIWNAKMESMASVIENDIKTVEEKIEELENSIASIPEDYNVLTKEVNQLSLEIEEIESRFVPIFDNIGGMAIDGTYATSNTTDIRGVCVGCKPMEFSRIVLKQTITNNATLTVAIYDKTLGNKLLQKEVDVIGSTNEQEIVIDFEEKIVMSESWYLDVQLPFNTDNTFTSYTNSAELNYSVVDSYSYPSYMYIKVSKERFSNQFKTIPCDFFSYLGIGIDGLIVEEKESEIETENNSTVPFSMFDTFGIIGDSFSVGYVKYNEYGVTKTNYAWGNQIARKYGNKCEIYGKGGISTRTWLSDSECLDAMNNGAVNDMYFLALGINDADGLGVNYLGTIADIHDGNPSENPDTFYGNYGKIVEAVKTKSQHAKLCFVTIPGITSIQKTFGNAIKEIAEHYGCVVADIQNDTQFQSKVRYYDGHLTYPLYGFMGVRIVELLEKQLLNDYFKDFMDFK